MASSVRREQIMQELEKKWKRNDLKRFIDKMAEAEAMKRRGDDEIFSEKKRVKADEIIDRIDSDRKDRFCEDTELMEAMAKLRKGKPFKVHDVPALERENLGIMCPIDPSVLAVLYEGYNNLPGREHYLKLRRKLEPWQRYTYSPTYNLDYGWRVEEKKSPADKQFAKIEIINRTFYRRNGVKGETLRNNPASNHDKPDMSI